MTDVHTLHELSPADRVRMALGSPGAFYMTGEDALQISGWNITASARLRASVRFLGLDGRIQANEHDLALTTDRVIASLVRQLGEGWLLGLTLRVVGATSLYGATYARAQIVRGLEASGIVLGTLCAGYVTSAQPIAFPGGRVLSGFEGPGNFRSITGTDPAANTEFSETVPAGVRWRLAGLQVSFTTDATAANRFPRLLIDDGTLTVFSSDPGGAQAASLVYNYASGDGVQRLANAFVTQLWTVPNVMILLPGYRLRSVTFSMQAGDNYAAPQLYVEEWIDAG